MAVVLTILKICLSLNFCIFVEIRALAMDVNMDEDAAYNKLVVEETSAPGLMNG